MDEQALLAELIDDGMTGLAADLLLDMGMDLEADWMRSSGVMPPFGAQRLHYAYEDCYSKTCCFVFQHGGSMGDGECEGTLLFGGSDISGSSYDYCITGNGSESRLGYDYDVVRNGCRSSGHGSCGFEKREILERW